MCRRRSLSNVLSMSKSEIYLFKQNRFFGPHSGYGLLFIWSLKKNIYWCWRQIRFFSYSLLPVISLAHVSDCNFHRINNNIFLFVFSVFFFTKTALFRILTAVVILGLSFATIMNYDILAVLLLAAQIVLIPYIEYESMTFSIPAVSKILVFVSIFVIFARLKKITKQVSHPSK